MAFKSYYTIDGQIIGERNAGGRTNYCTDALGSVTATVDSSGNVANTYRYKPYGATLAKTGTSADPKNQWVGSYGYRSTGRTQIEFFTKSLHYSRVNGVWTTIPAIICPAAGYAFSPMGQAFNCPSITVRDNSSAWSNPPTCKQVKQCLDDYFFRCECASGGKEPNVSVTKALCVFWQETSLGVNNPPGGIGSCTADCFNELRRRGCSWLSTFKDYQDFVKSATKCEKARAAYDYMATVGLDKYGPGKGKPGDYRGVTGEKVKKCEKCFNDPEQYFPDYQCLRAIIAIMEIPGNDNVTLKCGLCFSLIHR